MKVTNRYAAFLKTGMMRKKSTAALSYCIKDSQKGMETGIKKYILFFLKKNETHTTNRK